MRLFLDVDGVILLPTEGYTMFNFPLKEGADELIRYGIKHFDCYWLTGWAPNGRKQLIDKYLLPRLPSEAAKINVAVWNNLKTEAITDGDFIWVDDNLLRNERDYLEQHGWLDRFVHINTSNPSLRDDIARIKHVASI